MKKNPVSLLFVPVILVLSACGSEDQSIKNQAKSYAMQYFPEKNSIEIPDSLLGKQESSSRATDNSGEAGSIFAKVNHRVTEAEVNRLNHQIPLLMLDAVWSGIQLQCKNFAPGEACTIPQDTIVLQLTNEIVIAAEAVAERIDAVNNNQRGGASFETNEPRLSMTSGDDISFGTIVYTSFSEASEFQYEVSLDLSEMERIIGLDNEDATTLLVKWPANKQRVTSSYRFENSDSKYVYTYSYLDDGNEESVKIQYDSSDKSSENLSNTYTEIITLKTLDGSNGEILVEFESRKNSELGMQSFFAIGEANNDSGTLRADFSSYSTKEDAGLVSYSKKEIFDRDGDVVNSTVCEENCEDQGAWTASGSTISTTSPTNTTTINGDKNQTTMTITETVTESPLIDISVSGLLEDGAYIIASDGFDGGIEDRLGYGSVTEGVAEFLYWGSEAEIGNAKIYTFKAIVDEAGYRPGYIEMDTAQITIAD